MSATTRRPKSQSHKHDSPSRPDRQSEPQSELENEPKSELENELKTAAKKPRFTIRRRPARPADGSRSWLPVTGRSRLHVRFRILLIVGRNKRKFHGINVQQYTYPPARSPGRPCRLGGVATPVRRQYWFNSWRTRSEPTPNRSPISRKLQPSATRSENINRSRSFGARRRKRSRPNI